jgi:predicted dehydrogenase
MVHNKVRWGLIGLGKIAHKFAEDLQLSENTILQAVGSRSLEKAEVFGDTFGAIDRYGSYEELAASADVDVIYVATPHVFHFEITMMCLKHGKAVLCEKPLGMNNTQVEAMMNEAKRSKLFLMEGLWTRFIPATEKVLELIETDAIGEVKFIRADFGFKGKENLKSRVYDKKLGAGSLMDIGIYPIYLSLLILGVPAEIKAMARLTDDGVDTYCSMLFDYDNSAKASLESTIEADTPVEAVIYGSKGVIKIHRRFHHSKKVSLFRNGELKNVFDMGYDGNGYQFEIEEVNSCLIEKRIESKKLPLSLSLDLISIMDRVRAEIGVTYENADPAKAHQ